MQKIEPSFLKMLQNDQGSANKEKLYSCIVYTTAPDLIRAKGIIVNSVLPKFITVQARFNQIVEMSKMEEVTYIEAPDTVEVTDK